jgi:hypothetical protein
MTPHLIASVERYPKDLNQNLIHPICAEDARIISKLIEITKELGLKELITILNQYKFLKDTEIYNALLDFHTKVALDKEASSEEEGSKVPSKKRSGGGLGFLFTRNWIYFKDFRIDLFHIECYEKRDEYKVATTSMIYQIIINPLTETTAPRNVTTNKIISYTDMEQRDQDFEQLDNYISNFPGIRFINDRNE